MNIHEVIVIAWEQKMSFLFSPRKLCCLLVGSQSFRRVTSTMCPLLAQCCYSILECYNLFSGVKFSTRSFCFIYLCHLPWQWKDRKSPLLTKLSHSKSFPFAVLWTSCTGPHLKISLIPIFTFHLLNYNCVSPYTKQFSPQFTQKGRNKEKITSIFSFWIVGNEWGRML